MAQFYLHILLILVSLLVVLSFQPIHRRPVSSSRRSASMKTFSVRVINKKKNYDKTIEMPSNKFMLDVGEPLGAPIPYSCRAGSCSSCLGKLIEGTVDQSSQIFLESDKVDQGYVLTCVAYPTSDVVVEVDIEDEFYNNNPELV